MKDVKKPRLFYWEDVEGAWCSAEGLRLSDIVSIDRFDFPKNGSKNEIRLKRIDMTDNAYGNLPETGFLHRGLRAE